MSGSGPDTPAVPRSRTGRGVDRLINFTDAVVAVAITLLVLPLVDLRPEGDQTFADVVRDNLGALGTFLLTFFLVGILWLAHNRVLNGIAAYDGLMFWLNMAWLACVALLPWLSAQLGDSGWDSATPDRSIGVAFWGVMGLAALCTAGISAHLRRHPDLLEPDVVAGPRATGLAAHRGTVLGLTFLVLALLSWVAPTLAQWAPLVIIPISLGLRSQD